MTSKATDKWAPENIRKITTSKDALTLAKAAGVLVLKGKDAEENGTVAAAKATHAAWSTNLIADTRVKGGVAPVMSMGEYAKILHKPQSMVSRLRKIGHALVVVGIVKDQTHKVKDQSFPLWQVLANKGGADKIGDTIYGMTTVDAIVTALLKSYGPDGSRLSDKDKGGKGKARKAASENADGTLSVTTTDEDGEAHTETVDAGKYAVTLAKTLEDHLRRNGKDVSDADMSVVRKVLTGILSPAAKPAPRKRTSKAAPKSAPSMRDKGTLAEQRKALADKSA